MSNFKHKGSFPIPASLIRKIKSTVKLVEENPDSSKSKTMVIDIVNNLIKEALDYYFHYSLKIIGLNMIVRKTIKSAFSPFKASMQVIAKQIIKSMSDKQLVATINFIDGFTS